jgi:hypothetical protein
MTETIPRYAQIKTHARELQLATTSCRTRRLRVSSVTT